MWITAIWRWATLQHYKRLRRLDLEILWPICCQRADNLDHAKAAFAVHAFHDRAWLCLGEREILRQIDALQPLPTGGVEL
jgi:hypothetical protein